MKEISDEKYVYILERFDRSARILDRNVKSQRYFGHCDFVWKHKDPLWGNINDKMYITHLSSLPCSHKDFKKRRVICLVRDEGRNYIGGHKPERCGYNDNILYKIRSMLLYVKDKIWKN